MSSQDLARFADNVSGRLPGSESDVSTEEAGMAVTASETTSPPNLPEGGAGLPSSTLPFLLGLSPFWHDRLIEAGLVGSMGLYYLVGNPTFGAGDVLHVPPYLYSLPFLLIFLYLSWYRLSFAVALLPVALPYYILQKTVFSAGKHHFDFSLAEITLAACALIALVQWLRYGKRWRYHLSLKALRSYLGPFALPILVFVIAALVSVVVAVARQSALRALREEVFDPLLYVVLVLCCLRTPSDLKRLLGALLGSALIVALVGLVQFFLFADGDRAHAMYGSPNSIGLFFDYALPVGMALLLFQLRKLPAQWVRSLLLILLFIPLISVLIFSQSLGTALALPVALLFILALSIRNRKVFWVGAISLVVLVLAAVLLFRQPLTHFISNWHDNSKGISTVSKRYYLWQTAWNMIRDHAIFGVGLDNWLCHYSLNNYCPASATQHLYIIDWLPNGTWTGLSDEPWLSHPHDIFLHVWVSIGIFGLLAFLALLICFFWLFARIVQTVRRSQQASVQSLEWIVLGVGGSFLAALCQGLIDSSFLEQDLAFCFWLIVAALLLLRVFTGTSWRHSLTR